MCPYLLAQRHSNLLSWKVCSPASAHYWRGSRALPTDGIIVVDLRGGSVAWRGGAVGRRVLDTQTLVVGRQWRVIAVITLTERDSDRRGRRGSGPPSKSRQAETRLCLAHSPGAGLTSGDGQLLVMDGGRAWHHVTQQRLSVTDHPAAACPPHLIVTDARVHLTERAASLHHLFNANASFR